MKVQCLLNIFEFNRGVPLTVQINKEIKDYLDVFILDVGMRCQITNIFLDKDSVDEGEEIPIKVEIDYSDYFEYNKKKARNVFYSRKTGKKLVPFYESPIFNKSLKEELWVMPYDECFDLIYYPE